MKILLTRAKQLVNADIKAAALMQSPLSELPQGTVPMRGAPGVKEPTPAVIDWVKLGDWATDKNNKDIFIAIANHLMLSVEVENDAYKSRYFHFVFFCMH